MKRLDVYLFEKQFFPTREKSKEAIINGNVLVDVKICKRASKMVDELNVINIVGKTLQYVSRAGLKLEGAQKAWNISFKNKVVLDVGASTGGFTDFALQNGASKVIALDVGTAQLHEKLLKNSKVVNLEKTDFRQFSTNENIDIVVCDCSFISLKLLIFKFDEIVKSGKELVVLIKPQFECGKEIAKNCNGIIKDNIIQEKIKKEIVKEFEKYSFKNIGTIDSPILGTKGNREFLAYFVKR